MFNILDFNSAKSVVLANQKKLNVISIGCDRGIEGAFPLQLCKNVCRLNMDDLNDFHIERWGKELIQEGYVFPEKEHILSALEFDKKVNGKIHIIHCFAGISRSTAIGYAILRGRGLDNAKSLAKIMEIQPHAEPNERIIKLTEEIFCDAKI